MRDRPNIFRARWQQELFDPTWLGLLINPFYFARRGLVKALRPLLGNLRGDVLDVGCGRKPYRHFVNAARYVGVDLDTPELRKLDAADIFYDGKQIPVEAESFDAVVCSQVFEHVFTPAEFLRELHRVLRTGGQLVLTTPFVWDEHSQPYDFGRYSSFGLRRVLEDAGFEIITQYKTCADGRALVQLAAAYLYKLVSLRNNRLAMVVRVLLIAPLNVFGGIVAFLLPANPDLYLDNVVLVRKPKLKSTPVVQDGGSAGKEGL
ncbi:MAG: class I SAM-dependent methyltransferase [Verrucomicrobia bacterium]|nr:class I SAM-dependent methyltransferase [Verrucomicrobiota bacterium]